MRPTLSFESRSLEFEFPSTRAAHDYLEQASRDDGFVLPLDRQLKPFESLESGCICATADTSHDP